MRDPCQRSRDNQIDCVAFVKELVKMTAVLYIFVVVFIVSLSRNNSVPQPCSRSNYFLAVVAGMGLSDIVIL